MCHIKAYTRYSVGDYLSLRNEAGELYEHEIGYIDISRKGIGIELARERQMHGYKLGRIKHPFLFFFFFNFRLHAIGGESTPG